MQNPIDIDLDQLQKTVRDIETCSSELTALKASVAKTVDNINNSGWDSTTKDKYIALCEAWDKVLIDQILGLETIKHGLELAKNSYFGHDGCSGIHEELRNLYTSFWL